MTFNKFIIMFLSIIITYKFLPALPVYAYNVDYAEKFNIDIDSLSPQERNFITSNSTNFIISFKTLQKSKFKILIYNSHGLEIPYEYKNKKNQVTIKSYLKKYEKYKILIKLKDKKSKNYRNLFVYTVYILPSSKKKINESTGGLSATYYLNTAPDKYKENTTDQQINFLNETGSPLKYINYRQWSAVWKGYLNIQKSNNYNFMINTMGGVKLYINNELIMNKMYNTKYESFISKNINLKTKNELKIEYTHKNEAFFLQLLWQNAEATNEFVIIPNGNLTPQKPITGKTEIKINDFQDDQTINYPLLLIRGQIISSNSHSKIILTCHNENNEFPVIYNQFKTLCLLEPGRNIINLSTADKAVNKKLIINYIKNNNPYFIRLYYILPQKGPDTFYTENKNQDNSTASAIRRIQLAGRMLQTFTAESLSLTGHDRQTFRLEEEPDGQVKVNIIYAPILKKDAHKYNGAQTWGYIEKQIPRGGNSGYIKNLAVVGWTDWDTNLGRAMGTSAYGGGNMAVKDSWELHTFPESIEEIGNSFTNGKVTLTNFARRLYWQEFSTSLGAMLHELGHTFQLTHLHNSQPCIMNRGFIFLNRTFTMAETDYDTGESYFILPEYEPKYMPLSINYLRYSEWFDFPENKKYPDTTHCSLLTYDNKIYAWSQNGIQQVRYMLRSSIADVGDFYSNNYPDTVTLQKTNIEARFKVPDCNNTILFLIDTNNYNQGQRYSFRNPKFNFKTKDKGIISQYYLGTNFNEQILVFTNKFYAYNWNEENFKIKYFKKYPYSLKNTSIRWKANLTPPYSGDYTFYLSSSERAQLKINNKVMITVNHTRHINQHSIKLNLDKNNKYLLEVEHINKNTRGYLSVEWEHEKIKRNIIKNKYLSLEGL